MQVFAETDRLILREIVPEDAEGLYELDSDPLVHSYLGNRPLTTMAQAAEQIGFIRRQYLDNGIGRWAVVEKSTGTFLGWSGLKLVRETINDHSDYFDLGYRLIRKFWGQGFASESAIAVLDYGFDVLALEEIFAAAHLDNIASNRILQKLGFGHRGDFEYDSARHNWYRMLARDWRQVKAR